MFNNTAQAVKAAENKLHGLVEKVRTAVSTVRTNSNFCPQRPLKRCESAAACKVGRKQLTGQQSES